MSPDETILMPLGIPLGKLPPSTDNDGGYLVRRRREFCVLDQKTYVVWCEALSCRPRQALLGDIAEKWRYDREVLDTAVEEMLQRSLLIEVSGSSEESWPLIRSLRPLPRAIAIGYWDSPPGSFLLVSPDVKGQMVLDAVAYELFSRFDGVESLETAVKACIMDTGFSPRFVRERCHSLLISTVRTSLLIADVCQS